MAPRHPDARRGALVGHDRALRAARRRPPRRALGPVSAPVGRCADARGGGCRPVGAADDVGERVEGAGHVVAGRGEHVHLAAVGHEVARLVGVGEERHRRAGVDEHEVAQPGELRLRHLAEVLQLLDGRDAGAALGARRRTSRRAAGRPVPAATRAAATSGRAPQRRAAEQQGHRLARAQRPWRRRRRRRRRPSAGVAARERRRTGAAPSLHDTSAGRISVATWPGRAARPRRRPRPSSGTGRPCAPGGRSSPTRCAPRCRCRSSTVRRSGRGRWRGRRRC